METLEISVGGCEEGERGEGRVEGNWEGTGGFVEWGKGGVI